MSYFSHIYRIKYLVAIVCLGLLALMAFQINWLKSSKKLIEEQFDQKVTMAIGATLSDFNAEYKTELNIEDLETCSDDDVIKCIDVGESFMTESRREELKENLNGYMGCYGIDEKYSVTFFNETSNSCSSAYCSSISADAACNMDYKLGVSFLSRQAYLFDKMKFMILSSILIFILLATVSFIILNALLKQKRLTENNIDFFNNTAHELKTPLTNISLALNLLQRKNDFLKENKYARIIKSESNKLTRQIERVLFLSKMENGDYKLRTTAIDIKKVLTEVIENMSMLIEERSGVININFPDKNITVLGDAYHLSNVFRNLIDNALKYCDEKPIISITLVEKDNHLHLRFDDNGIGISKHDQCHIFEKFQRVNTGNTRDAKGFGIGLSYVKTVMQMHKGFIHVDSEPNKGATFELLIPSKAI